ncbi:MAG: Gfo/Idh/MocA family oxidoreductase [Gaiellales bacterium]
MAVTVAILGGGFMGAAHAGNYAALRDRVRVKTVFSRTPEKAQRVADVVGAGVTTDLESVLADPELDAVDISLPTPLHRSVAEQAFAAGKHVFLEKPLALTVEDGEAIVAAAERSGRIFMVGLVLRFWPEYVELRRRVAAGELGRPLAVTAYRLSPPADWTDWYADVSVSGGPVVDLMVHDFDQMNWLLGTPRTVYARAVSTADPAYPDHVHAIVEYEGAQASVEGSMAMPKAFPFSSTVRVVCERGAAEYSFRAAPAEDGGNIGAVDPSARGLRLYPRGGDPETVLLDPVDPWGPEIEEFVSCLEQGRQPENGTGAQALLGLRVSLAASRSLASGRPEVV